MTEGMEEKVPPEAGAGSPPDGAPGGEPPTAAGSGAKFSYSDAMQATSSQRRFLPPDSKPALWWIRYREQLGTVELVLAGLFLLLTLYFLYLWIFSSPTVSYEPGREGFVRTLAALPPLKTEAAWRVKATPGRWRNIVIHHTATDKGDPAAIDRFHREVRKWENGLGYHFLIGNGNGLGDGEVHPSRRWLEQLDGAHVKMQGYPNGNSFAIGVALVGNFEEKMATPKQLAALRGLLHYLMMEYGIKHSEVVGHGSVATKYTACPGCFFFLDELVKSL